MGGQFFRPLGALGGDDDPFRSDAVPAWQSSNISYRRKDWSTVVWSCFR